MRTLSREEVKGLGIPNADLMMAMEGTIRASRAGEIAWRPKSTIAQPDGAFFLSSMACAPKRNIAVFHTVAGLPACRAEPSKPHYYTYQLVINYQTGIPIAMVDGTFTANMLPAVITLLGARYLARPDSRIATFVGAGVQADVNLATLRTGFPVDEVRILTRTAATAGRFAECVQKQGITPHIISDPKAAVLGADIIVTSVPSRPDLKPFLDPAWVSPGAYVSAVDVGRSWMDGFDAFDRIVADDRAQAVIQHAEGRMRYGGKFDSELADLVTGTRPSRQRANDRAVLIHPGYVVGTLAITLAILERAGITTD
jgi:ornithine cyclodeaminase/alanine dehydrogenase-like protein (mu-crystallin family)